MDETFRVKEALFNPITALLGFTVVIGYALTPIFALFLEMNSTTGRGVFNQWVPLICAVPIAFILLVYLAKKYHWWGVTEIRMPGGS